VRIISELITVSLSIDTNKIMNCRDLKDAMDNLSLSSSVSNTRPVASLKTLLPSFHQPVAMPDFFDRIRDQKVLLENAYVGDGGLCIKGTVRVKNMDFHKSVYVRFSYDDWNSFQDFQVSFTRKLLIKIMTHQLTSCCKIAGDVRQRFM